jgi:hypothetical protein
LRLYDPAQLARVYLARIALRKARLFQPVGVGGGPPRLACKQPDKGKRRYRRPRKRISLCGRCLLKRFQPIAV